MNQISRKSFIFITGWIFLFLSVCCCLFGFPDSFVFNSLINDGFLSTLSNLQSLNRVVLSVAPFGALEGDDLFFFYAFGMSQFYLCLVEILLFCAGLGFLIVLSIGPITSRRLALSTFFVLLVILLVSLCSPYTNLGLGLGGFFTTDSSSLVLKSWLALLFLGLLLIFLNNTLFIQNARGEVWFLYITLIWALFSLLGSNDLFLTYLLFEALSFSICLLLIFSSFANSRIEAAIKYFILNGVASILVCFSAIGLFLVTGSLKFDILVKWSGQFNTESSNFPTLLVLISTIILVCALLGKLGTFPFSIWLVDVYSISSFLFLGTLLIPVKFVIFLVLLKFIITFLFSTYAVWSGILFITGVASLVYGCLGALRQVRIKRFIAFTTINQAGFLVVGTAIGSFDAIVVTLVYLIVYSLTTLLLFMLFGLWEQRIGRPILYFKDLQGLFTLNKSIACALALVMFSYAGIPPLAGFYTKYYLFVELFKGQFFIVVWVLLLTSFLSTFYYIRIIKLFFDVAPFEQSSPTIFFNTHTGSRIKSRQRGLLLMLSVLVSFLVVFFYVQDLVYSLCQQILLSWLLSAITEAF